MAGKTDTLNLLVQIIREFLNFKNDQVVVYNQGWKIPADSRVYVSVGLVSSRAFGSRRSYEDSPDGKSLLEVIILNTQELISLNVYSFSEDAIEAKDAVMAALHSTLGEQLMEQYQFKLASIPTPMQDLSGLEGASRLYRFQATVAVLRGRRKENVVQYYDDFPTPKLILNP